MAEDGEEIPVLSIGSVNEHGPQNYEWQKALRPIAGRIKRMRDNVHSPLHLNVIYLIPGPTLQPDFEGVRTGHYSRARHALIVQAALPQDPSAPYEEVVRTLLLAAVDAAEEFARRRKIAESLPQLRELAAAICKTTRSP